MHVDPELGGWLWLIVDVVGVVVLGLVLVYGILNWRRYRQRISDPERAAAIRRAFREPKS